MTMFWLNLPGGPFRSRCHQKPSPGATDSSRSGNGIFLTQSGGETIRLAVLVRLDRRVERLPEWLAEARRALDLAWYDRPSLLAALAGWRPRPGDALPHGDKVDAAQAWVQFWEKLYQHPGSQPDGLFAAAALLYLAEAG